MNVETLGRIQLNPKSPGNFLEKLDNIWESIT